MSAETIVIDANSLEEARARLQAQKPQGLDLLSEKVITDGTVKEINGFGETTEEAYANAQLGLPDYAEALTKNEIRGPSWTSISVEAFDEESAIEKVNTELTNSTKLLFGLLKGIKLVAPGKKGLAGIGKKPHQYEAQILLKAFVKITYQQKTKVEFTIGKVERSYFSARELDIAERDNSPVDVTCDQCGKTCTALGRPPAGNVVMVLTADVAMVAARYCPRCNIVVCGECAGASRFDTGPVLSGRPCPRCHGQTTAATAADLRRTTTAVALSHFGMPD